MSRMSGARDGNACLRRRRCLVALSLVAVSFAMAGCRQRIPTVHELPLAEETGFAWPRQDHVRAFYSGHSLSDGVPEAVSRVATVRGQTLTFKVQSLGYSLLRERPPGADLSSSDWDALVVTERHDLPWAAASEGTAGYLANIATLVWQRNPKASVFFYHTWLALDRASPAPWIQYERKTQRLWECVASRANLDVARGDARIRVLPGGRALADLVELLWADKVPGLSGMTPAARVGLLFRDEVHLSPEGTAFMGLVHYAFLFGVAPTGSPLVGVLTRDTMTFLEGLAFRAAADYARVADAAASRDMEACRAFAATDMRNANQDLPARGWREWALRPYRNWRSQRIYADATSPQNPFGRP